MLALTPAAAEVVSTITSAAGMPDTAGLRIAPTEGTQENVGLEIQIVSAPDNEDQVVSENGGAQVFLEPRAAAYLSDKVLDGNLDSEGHASFTVVPQPGNNGAPTV